MATAAIQLQPTETMPEDDVVEVQAGPVVRLVSGPIGPPAFGSDVFLGSLGDARLRVSSPLRIRFSQEGEHVIAEAPDIDEFGFGSDVVAARVDLQRTIVELFFSLEREQARLGPDLVRVWQLLTRAVSRAR